MTPINQDFKINIVFKTKVVKIVKVVLHGLYNMSIAYSNYILWEFTTLIVHSNDTPTVLIISIRIIQLFLMRYLLCMLNKKHLNPLIK